MRDEEGADDLAAAESGVSLTRAELVRAAGMTDEDLARLEEYGLVTPSHSSGERVLFDDDALGHRPCLRGVHAPRHRTPPPPHVLARSPSAKASLFEQVLLPYRRQRNPEAQARVAETLGELSGLGRRLRTALLRQTVRRTFNN